MLKTGLGEKRIASEMGISRHTVHVYVWRLYEHFDVHSRAELLSLLLNPNISAQGMPASNTRMDEWRS